MSLTFGFYNSENGDRRYNASQISSMFDGVIKDGIFEAIGDKLMVSEGSGMTVNVGTGRAWFNQTWLYNDSILPIEVAESELVLNRIDTIVVDIDKPSRMNKISIIKGTPASNPVSPTLINDLDYGHYQYPLCDIYVGEGVTEITQENITNRVGIDCPFVTGAVQNVSVDGLVAQWQASFNAWMAGLRDILGEDAAAEMAARILELEDDKLTRTTADGAKNKMGVQLDMNTYPIINLAMPRTGSEGAGDAACRYYVDTQINTKATKWVTLWTNAKQTSSFVPQTLSISAAGYNAICVRCRYNANHGYEQSVFLMAAGGGICYFPRFVIPSSADNSTVDYECFRQFEWSGNDILVRQGRTKAGCNDTIVYNRRDDYAIPIAIYGLKWIGG